MSPRQPPSAEVQIQAEKLSNALKEAAKRGISRRQIAKFMAGEDATNKQVENRKNQLVKWSRAYNGINDANAAILGKAFQMAGFPGYDADYFLKTRPAGSSWMQAAKELVREEYFAEMARLREELEEIRKENAALAEEIKGMKEAS